MWHSTTNRVKLNNLFFLLFVHVLYMCVYLNIYNINIIIIIITTQSLLSIDNKRFSCLTFIYDVLYCITVKDVFIHTIKSFNSQIDNSLWVNNKHQHRKQEYFYIFLEIIPLVIAIYKCGFIIHHIFYHTSFDFLFHHW